MMVCYMNEYIFLLSSLWCLLGTSIMYWNDMTNRVIYKVDRGLAVSVLGIKSHIANNHFSAVGKQIWYSSLLITGSAYMLSLYIFETKRENSNKGEGEVNDMRRSVYYHMFFVHFLPTTTFSICVLYY